MAYTTPRTWVAGDVLTAAQLNVDIRDNIAFLANRPCCRVTHNAAQSIPSNTNTLVAFNTERYDTDTMHDTVTNNSRITIKTAGVYEFVFHGEFGASANPQFQTAYIRLNGGTNIGVGQASDYINTGGRAAGVHASTVYKCAVNDYVEILVVQINAAAAAANLNSTGNLSPEFAATWQAIG